MKIPYNEYFNRDDVFFRRLLVGALASLNLRIFWYNVLNDGTEQKISVPFYFSTTGDERFLVDTFMKPIASDDKGCVAETFYNQIPRAIVNFESVSILEDALRNRFIRGEHLVDSKDGELKTYSSEIKSIPVSINLSITGYCDSHLDLLKFTESIIDNFHKHIEYNIEHKGIRCPASVEFPSDYSQERLIDFSFSDRKEFKVNFDITIKSIYPIIKSSTTMFAGNRMGNIATSIFVGTNNTFQYTQSNNGFTTPQNIIDQNVITYLYNIGMTNVNVQNSVNRFIRTLKDNFIYDDIDIIYLFLGATQDSKKINLINPIDDDSGFRLDFIGDWQFIQNGIKPNGINCYANTFYNQSVRGILNSQHVAIYSLDDIEGLKTDIGLYDPNTGIYNDITPRYNSGGDKAFLRNQTSQNINVNNSNSKGVFINNRITSFEQTFLFNDTLQTINSNSSGLINGEFILSGLYNTVTNLPMFLSDRGLGYVSIGKGISNEKMIIYNNAIKILMNELGRV